MGLHPWSREIFFGGRFTLFLSLSLFFIFMHYARCAV